MPHTDHTNLLSHTHTHTHTHTTPHAPNEQNTPHLANCIHTHPRPGKSQEGHTSCKYHTYHRHNPHHTKYNVHVDHTHTHTHTHNANEDSNSHHKQHANHTITVEPRCIVKLSKNIYGKFFLRSLFFGIRFLISFHSETAFFTPFSSFFFWLSDKFFLIVLHCCCLKQEITRHFSSLDHKLVTSLWPQWVSLPSFLGQKKSSTFSLGYVMRRDGFGVDLPCRVAKVWPRSTRPTTPSVRALDSHLLFHGVTMPP